MPKQLGKYVKQKVIKRSWNSINIQGKVFGRLIALKYLKTENKMSVWLFRCTCGNFIERTLKNVVTGNTKSCGCYAKEKSIILNTSHKMSKTRFYRIWGHLKNRCFDIKNKHYGGNGIVVCKRWLEFTNFRDDMYKSYLDHVKKFGEKETTIDRRDNKLGYTLENCRWATRKEQNINRGCNNPAL